MKNAIHTILFIVCAMVAGNAAAQMTFDKAKELNSKKEYRKAVAAFAELKKEALAAGDECLYMDCLLAEGEAAYMLDWTSTMCNVLNEAMEHFESSTLPYDNDSIYLAWGEAIQKLTGSYCYCMMDIDESAYYYAVDAYNECLNLIEALKEYTLDDNPLLKKTVERELLNLYYKRGHYEAALEMADIVYDHWMNYYDEERFIDAATARAMVLARLNRFDEALECIGDIYDSMRNKIPGLYRVKGKILMMQHDYDGSDNIKEAKRCYENYIKYLKEEIESQIGEMTDVEREQYWLEVSSFLFDCYRLGAGAPEMLYDLALYSKGYLLQHKIENKEQYSWKDVKRALKKNECAIEFIQYKGKNDEEWLGALVVKPDSKKPEFVEIGKVETIGNLETIDGPILSECIAYDDAFYKNALYSDSTIYQYLWTDELLSAIGNKGKVYFAPDGITHQIAIEYMLPDSTIDCRRLSSTRVLLTHKRVKNGNMLLCGGVDYYAYIDNRKEENDVEGFMMLHNQAGYISDLPGTDNETREIYTMRKLENRKDTVLKGSAATDDNIATLANSGYSLVHLSTHGYFTGIQDGTDIKPAISDNALSESGIIFAGAGKNLIDENFDPYSSDGILTAKEISEMDLSNVELMVLSACQTGLGYVTSDGVYGMQRALKLAGVKSMMLTLWSVSDYASYLLMLNFYKELEKDKSAEPDIHKAFNKARRTLIEGEKSTERFSVSSLSRRTTKNKFDAPHYINAFIIIDAL